MEWFLSESTFKGLLSLSNPKNYTFPLKKSLGIPLTVVWIWKILNLYVIYAIIDDFPYPSLRTLVINGLIPDFKIDLYGRMPPEIRKLI